MDQVTPQWRSFSSESPSGPPQPADADGPTAQVRSPANEPTRPGTATRPGRSMAGNRTLLIGLLGGLGVAATAITVIIGLLLVSGTPAAILVPGVGEPIDGDGATGSDPAVLAGPSDVTFPGGPGVAAEIVVDVAGAVARPGLHRLRAGDRVGDAVEAAGGFGPRVDLIEVSQTLNLAQPLSDGTKVLVPELGTHEASAASTGGDGRIDLNQADQATLETLPGIGPVTAGKIITAREERSFETVRELRGRGLVGESVFEDVRDLVSVGR